MQRSPGSGRRSRWIWPLWLASLPACPGSDAAPATSGEPGTTGEGLTDTTATQPATPTTGGDDPSTTALATSTGEGDGSSGEGTTAPPPPICGDGQIDPGEECDLGFDENGESGACTHLCRLAFCGDGLVQAGVEACDAGPDSNDSAYNGCTSRCLKGPHCGDDEVQGPEECDAGALNGSERLEAGASVPCSMGCRFEARIAFVTSVAYTGALNGIAGADKICETLAEAAMLDNAGDFRAWLSTGDKTAGGRFLAAETTPALPFVLLGGEMVAEDVQDLLDDGPRVPLRTAETGEIRNDPVFVWTNTGVDGSYFYNDKHCDHWTKLEGPTRVGVSAPDEDQALDIWMDGPWTSASDWACFQKAHLYCFEIGGP